MNVNTIEETVYEYIRKYDLLRSGDHVLAAVSGGADSVCLLLLLNRLRTRLDIRLEAVTVNHGIRGTSAAADVDYVEQLCGIYEIPLHICQVSVPDFLRQHPMSEEEAARKLRYQCFDRVAREIRANAVAVAHHREDNCETVLHHLFRGSSLRGLSGMEPTRVLLSEESESCGFQHMNDRNANTIVKNEAVRLVRPLLELSRQEIEGWLGAQKISWQTDETNLTDDYTRNRLRHQIIPQITKQINTQAVPHILQAAKDICEAQELVEELALDWLSDYEIAGERKTDKDFEKMEEISIPVQEFRRCRPIIRREILIQLGKRLTGTSDFKDVGRVHLDMILDLAEKGTSKRLELPAGLRVRKEYEKLVFHRADKKNKMQFHQTADSQYISDTSSDFVQITADLKSDSMTVTAADGISPENYDFRIFLYDNDKKIPENNYTKWFDYDKIKNGLSLRTRRTGDYFILDGGGRKTVKSYMIDRKIPAAKRDQMPMLAEGNHVLWLADGRISAAYKVTERTRRVLELAVRSRKTDFSQESP